MQLVIVESPTKAKTIGKFLGKEYSVKSSFGHVRDLPKSKMGVDIEKNFKPEYVIPAKARKTITELKTVMDKSDEVILATDSDREGEAIAWHLAQALGLGKVKSQKSKIKNIKETKRIVFHEITKGAIEKAMQESREIDMNLVNAQQARRILDRLVGYELSPFLWTKIRYGLSAGRVQSVAVRLIVEREREIENFKKEEYWTIEADFVKHSSEDKFHAILSKKGAINKLKNGEGQRLDKFNIKTKDNADDIVRNLEGSFYSVIDITKKETKRTPYPPFITSTLQQDASHKLNMSAKQTMMHAQRLYEVGLITYMRTDSVNIAETALSQAKEIIGKQFGRQYILDSPRRYKTKSKGAQEAHEAIRPTNLSVLPKNLSNDIDSGQRRLYELIWKRMIASQMQHAVLDNTSVDILADTGKQDGYVFKATGQVVKFEGYMRVYGYSNNTSSKHTSEIILPTLEKGDKLNLAELLPLQHFTEPPARYTDATLIKALEAHEIGRPSTYAPTLTTIQDRNYVKKEDKKYFPTEEGILVNDLLVEHFPNIVDIEFTSHVEEELDDIAKGKLPWTGVVKEFYEPFKKDLDKKTKSVKKIEETSTTPCVHCGKMMIVKFGRNGKFLACPDPESKITRPLPEEEAVIRSLENKTEGEKCPICGNNMKVRRGRFGFFLGCIDYPNCKGVMKILNRIGFKCPNCVSEGVGEKSGDIVEKKSRGRGRIFYACSRYPDCDFLINKIPSDEGELQSMYKAWKEALKKPSRAKRKGKNLSTF